jgi:hypothetical protein
MHALPNYLLFALMITAIAARTTAMPSGEEVIP